MLEAGIHALLTACAVLTDIVPADRITPGLMLHQTTYPALSYRVTSATKDFALDRTATQEKRIQFAARSVKYSDVKLIESALLRILGGYSGHLGNGINVLGSFPGVVVDSYDPDTALFLTESEFDLQFVELDAGDPVEAMTLPDTGADLLSLEAGLHSLLESNLDVAVYPVYIPEATAFPAMSYQTVSASADYALDGSIIQTKRIQFDLFASKYLENKRLETALAGVLDRYDGTLPNGARVINAVSESVDDDWAETRLYRTSIDYSIDFTQ